jgi:hypothetical protein
MLLPVTFVIAWAGGGGSTELRFHQKVQLRHESKDRRPAQQPCSGARTFSRRRSAFELAFTQIQDAPSEFAHLTPRVIESKLAKAVINEVRYSDKTVADISRDALLVLRSAA